MLEQIEELPCGYRHVRNLVEAGTQKGVHRPLGESHQRQQPGNMRVIFCLVIRGANTKGGNLTPSVRKQISHDKNPRTGRSRRHDKRWEPIVYDHLVLAFPRRKWTESILSVTHKKLGSYS